MPAALDVDWAAVQTLATAVGVREAARRMGLSEDAVMQRSHREGWLRNLPRSVPLPPTVLQPVSVVSTAAFAMAQSMAEDALTGRAAALRATRKALVHMAEYEPDKLCDKDTAQTLHVHVKSAAVAGGYGSDSRPDSPARSFGARDTGLVIDAEPIQEDDSGNVPHTIPGQEQIIESPK